MLLIISNLFLILINYRLVAQDRNGFAKKILIKMIKLIKII
jgi:hypothetical protein